MCKYESPFKFIIYTTSKDIIEPYVEASNGRLELRGYIPREELLFELSKMDFLININNGTSVQTPSKLIDYALTKRPILSIDTEMKDRDMVNEFLQGNYSRQFEVENFEKYQIVNVVRQFLELCEN